MITALFIHPIESPIYPLVLSDASVLVNHKITVFTSLPRMESQNYQDFY